MTIDEANEKVETMTGEYVRIDGPTSICLDGQFSPYILQKIIKIMTEVDDGV